jgi:hypothetical protein
MTWLRPSDLESFFSVRYGDQLPPDDAGREDLIIAFNHIAGGRIDVVNRCLKLAALWAPWMPREEATELAEEIAPNPTMYSAEELGRLLGLTDRERTTGKIKTIRPIDLTWAEMQERNRRLECERKREKRRIERAKKPPPLSQTQPWLSEGISRSTWFSRNRKTSSQERRTKSVRNRSITITPDAIRPTAIKPTPTGIGPTPIGFDLKKKSMGHGPAPAGLKLVPRTLTRTWRPSKADVAYAMSQGIPRHAIDWEAEGFVLWHLARGKSPWPNPYGAWRSWCDRYLQYKEERYERDHTQHRRDEWFRKLAG